MEWTIYDATGSRKYLSNCEVERMMQSGNKIVDSNEKLFCEVLICTGCRISEALELRYSSLDFDAQSIVIRCLKKRNRIVFRAVPVPPELLSSIAENRPESASFNDRIWNWSRMTAYRKIKRQMDLAMVQGSFASPKGLRHAFGVRAVQSGIPLNLLQRWLGHADIKTTAIYANVVGPEELELASRMWR